MGFMQSLALGKKMVMWLLGIPLVPIFCVIYIVSPKSKVCFAATIDYVTPTLQHASCITSFVN